MSKIYSPSMEKRARDMYQDSRKGLPLNVQWTGLSLSEKEVWLDKALEIEAVISAKLAAR